MIGRRVSCRIKSYRNRVIASLAAAFSSMIASTAAMGFYLARYVPETEVHRTLFLAACASVLILMGAVLTVVLMKLLSSPLRELADAAGKLSRGDLRRPIPVWSQDELGDLALSLERIRSSLSAAMIRLRHESR